MGFFGKLVAALMILWFGYGLAEAYFGWGVPKLYNRDVNIRQASSRQPMAPNEFTYIGGVSYRGHPRGGGIHSGK